MKRFLQRIAEQAAVPGAGGPLVIVAFGDSVTMGATAPGVLEPDAVYHHRLKRLLAARYPQAVFSVINAGIGGQTAAQGLARLDRDVLRFEPDLVLIGFGLNDASADAAKRSAFSDCLRQMLGLIQGRTAADIVLLTPNFMADRPNDAVRREHRPMLARMVQLQRAGFLARYAQAIREVGQTASVAVADVYQAWADLAGQGVDTTAMLANGLNHPTGAAHAIAARCILQQITSHAPAVDVPAP